VTSKRRKILFALVAALALAILLTFAFREKLLTAAADWLVVEDELYPADVIFLFNGGNDTRPFHAGELFEQGLAPKIIIVRAEDTPTVELDLYPNSTDVATGVLRELGVPEANIEEIPVMGGVTSTREEAVALRQYIEESGIGRVILVTSALHTRRSSWIVRKELDGADIELAVSAAPHYGFDVSNWWQDERGLISLSNEYLKLLYYLVSY